MENVDDGDRVALVDFVRRVAAWRPTGLFGEIEDDVAGLRQDAQALLDRMMVGKALSP
jgi:hypothetical protein